MKKVQPPQTEKEWAVYRCQACCKIGQDVLNDIILPPPGVSSVEYALYNLLHAVEELSRIK